MSARDQVRALLLPVVARFVHDVGVPELSADEVLDEALECSEEAAQELLAMPPGALATAFRGMLIRHAPHEVKTRLAAVTPEAMRSVRRTRRPVAHRGRP